VAATGKVLTELTKMVSLNGHREALRFTSAIANGRDLFAFRYAANDKANSLYYRESGGNVVVVSEPLDSEHARWKPVPPGHMLVALEGRPVALEPFLREQRVAAE
jgi:predicted glutamine amidotransferase